MPPRMSDELSQAEAEGVRVADRVLAAEQEERRRLADFLHDTSVQALSGIALMLDAGLHAIEARRLDEAQTMVATALERQRAAIRALRDLSFDLEPVVLRDQGFTPAVEALASRLGLERELQIDVAVDAAETLGEQAQAALYQIVREALHGSIGRGPPTRITIRVQALPDGGVEAVVADDARGERRRSTLEAIGERARTLNAQFSVEAGDEGGTTVRVAVPPYVARG